eukprot:TRINITY_DN4630_c0_g1_i3.p1 TRINITY_DN4630_c0_g1~~TRINITY_DN4630_c0_g1_i3.p1  ORF type:complete len:254 (+),score=80.28 TRINITY_DN4630_c0_g1_i3:127-888(+)
MAATGASIDLAAPTSDPSPFGDRNLVEQNEPIQIQVDGKIPSWVSGTLFRTGLGKFSVDRPDGSTFYFHHPFDGLSMIHRFRVEGGDIPKVYYSSRHLAKGVEERIKNRDSTLVFFGPDPCKTIFGKVQSLFLQIKDKGSGDDRRRMEQDPMGENINVTVTPNFPLGRKREQEWGIEEGMALVMKTDANMLQLLDPDTMKPKKLFTYGHIDEDPIFKGRSAASHHQRDEETGEYINFTMEFHPVPKWHVFSNV